MYIKEGGGTADNQIEQPSPDSLGRQAAPLRNPGAAAAPKSEDTQAAPRRYLGTGELLASQTVADFFWFRRQEWGFHGF